MCVKLMARVCVARCRCSSVLQADRADLPGDRINQPFPCPSLRLSFTTKIKGQDKRNEIDPRAMANTLSSCSKKPTEFHDTTHAEKRRRERDLSVKEMKVVVCEHEHRIQHRPGEHGGFVYEFNKTVQGEKWTVVAEIKRHECWLITGWREDDET